MRDFYREPVFYYVLAPILIGLWPLLVWSMYLPRTQEQYETEQGDLIDAQAGIMEILTLDPDRLDIVDPNDSTLGKFAFLQAIDRAVNLSNIPSDGYKPNIYPPRKVQGKDIQTARLNLEDIGIKQVAKFLTEIQSTWVNLTCDSVKLTHREGMSDHWDVDIDFTYVF